MPVAHSLLQIREELGVAVLPLSPDELWARPGGVASVGFHVKHLAGSLDRLLTYARGERLNDRQLALLEAEAAGVTPDERSEVVLRIADDAIERALDQLRATPIASLHEARQVG